MEKTWKPVAAGVLDIVAGACSVLCFIGLIIAFSVVTSGITGVPGLVAVPGIWVAPTVLLVLAVPSIIMGILAIMGGVYTLIRKRWGLAITGAIAATISNLLLGIPALIFIALAKDEFEQ